MKQVQEKRPFSQEGEQSTAKLLAVAFLCANNLHPVTDTNQISNFFSSCPTRAGLGTELNLVNFISHINQSAFDKLNEGLVSIGSIVLAAAPRRCSSEPVRSDEM